ncbi:MAG TPA: hypothetical protein VKM55_19735 [Candidatus Lokiarchaeia archaeon]|nr:hypothetical protein [Candidatus Lokiarchaeia archaeon]
MPVIPRDTSAKRFDEKPPVVSSHAHGLPLAAIDAAHAMAIVVLPVAAGPNTWYVPGSIRPLSKLCKSIVYP